MSAVPIALWGFGPYGQELSRLIAQCYCRCYEVTALFDRDPQGVDADCAPEGLEVAPIEQLRDCYASGRFEAVAVGIYKPEIRHDVERQLRSWGVPVITIEGLLGMQSGHFDNSVAVEKLSSRNSSDDSSDLTSRIVSHMEDEESVELLKARLDYAVGEERLFLQAVLRYCASYEFVIPELESAMQQGGADRVILYGDGNDGAMNLCAMKLARIPIAGLCSPKGRSFDCAWMGDEGYERIAPSQVTSPDYADCIFVISSFDARLQIRQDLERQGIAEARIFDPPRVYRTLLTGYRHGQYFDIWSAREDEVFVDCGAYDGGTIVAFLQWCKGHFRSIHALEPLPGMHDVIRKSIQRFDVHDFELYPVAAWSRSEELLFSVEQDASGSNVFSGISDSLSTITVQGAALDDLIEGPITFLKMDIEGSELDAINGAERLIRTWRPRLAISVYHRAFDIISIPARILELVPEYRFRVRHYGVGIYETVLYASVERDF